AYLTYDHADIENSIPTPSSINRRLALSIKSLNLLISSIDGTGIGGGVTAPKCISDSTGNTSSGSDTITGPGRPDFAVRKARCTISGIRSTSRTSTAHLAID